MFKWSKNPFTQDEQKVLVSQLQSCVDGLKSEPIQLKNCNWLSSAILEYIPLDQIDFKHSTLRQAVQKEIDIFDPEEIASNPKLSRQALAQKRVCSKYAWKFNSISEASRNEYALDILFNKILETNQCVKHSVYQYRRSNGW